MLKIAMKSSLFTFVAVAMALGGCDEASPSDLDLDTRRVAESDGDEIDDLESVDENVEVAFPGAPQWSEGFTNEDPGVAITGSNKVCSIIAPGNWRDTLVVPDGWTWHDCHSLRVTLGASQFQLGCVTNTGYSFSSANVTSWPASCS